MNNSKIIIAVIVLAVVAGGFYLISDNPSPADNKMDAQLTDQKTTNTDDVNLEGIHIMGDGSVMLGNGDVLEDATVTEDGMIELESGRVVEPVMDMRNADSQMEEDHKNLMEEGMESSGHELEGEHN